MTTLKKEKLKFDYSKLRGRIREKFKVESVFASKIGISVTTLSNRLNNHTFFTSEEIYESCLVLEISPVEMGDYFFKLKLE